MSAWVTGKVVEHKHWSDKLHTLFVEADIAPWQAGQFVKIGLDIGGEVVGRPYSLVNPPTDPVLEIYYIHVPEGALTPRLARLAPGDSLLVSPRANGFMVLDEIPTASTLWLMATGTGVGPFLAILDGDEVWSRYDHVVLVYAVRTLGEMSYRVRIDAVASSRSGQFSFVPFISREPHAHALPGRIPEAIENAALETRVGRPLDADTSQVVLCGNPDMVTDVTAALARRGMKKHRRRDPGQITSETYW